MFVAVFSGILNLYFTCAYTFAQPDFFADTFDSLFLRRLGLGILQVDHIHWGVNPQPFV